MAKAKIQSEINITAKAKYSQLGKFNQSLRQTESSLKKFQIGLHAVPKLLETVGRALKAAAQASMEFGSQIKDLAAQTGLGTEQVQVLGRVAAQNGSSIEEMGRALIKLTKSSEEAALGNKALAERFARLGIDVNKLKTLAPEKQMERLGLAVNAAKDKQAALVDVMALIGQDAGPKLMESLKKLGTQGYDTLAKKAQAGGEVLSGSAIESLDRAGQAFKDLGHWFKVMTGEIAGAAFAVKDALSEAVLGPKTQTLFQVIQEHGKASYEAAEAYMRLAQERFAEGDRALADRFLAEAEQWASKVRTALEQVEQVERIKTATLQDIAEVNAATFDILKGSPEKARAFLAGLDAVREQWAIVRAAEKEAEKVAGQGRLGALLTADAQAVGAAAKQWGEATKAQEAELVALRAGVVAGLKQVDDEVAQARDKLLGTIGSIEWSRLTEGEQLMAKTEQVQAQLDALYQAGVLGAEAHARAQATLNEELARSSALIAEEQAQAALLQAQAAEALKQAQDQAAFGALEQGVQNLIGEFERLDGVIEAQLSSTIKDFVETGTADMKKLGQSILNEVIQAMLKALVLKPLLTGLGGMFGGAAGGFFSGLSGAMGLPSLPGRASGGPVTGKRAYLVGERGPELFVPPHSGTIIDANKTAATLAGDTATGGDRGPQNVYQIDARGADAGAVQRLETALMRLAGPGVVERRARASEADRTRRG